VRPDITPRQGRRSALIASGFTSYWDAACSSRGLTMLVAEIAIPETAQSPAARSGREFLAATALTPAELDEVLSEIALLSMDDAGEPRWQVQQLGPRTAAAVAGGSWSTVHAARSFFLARAVRS
jgi:hypothetical protein